MTKQIYPAALATMLLLQLSPALAAPEADAGAAPATGQSANAGDDSGDFGRSMDAYLSDDKNVEKITKALERYIRKQQADQQRQAMEQEFANPAQIDIGESPVRGKADAPITIVEFSDFECPYCKRGAEVMEEVMKEHSEDVKLVFKNLPLPFHKNAKPAAIAALAAGAQGKFWEMHDQLFENQSNLKEATFVSIAEKLGLDVEKFKADLKDPKYAKQVDDDMAVGSKLGVQGTPGFFVNGVQVRGAQPLPVFSQIIEEWKKRLAEKK